MEAAAVPSPAELHPAIVSPSSASPPRRSDNVDRFSRASTADAGGPYSGAVGSPVQFDGSGSNDLDGSISSYAWGFGDGGTAKGKGPTHRYNLPGDYIVTLTVTDNDGNADSANTQAIIGD